MPLRPDDVVRKSFTTSVLRRGYDEKQVDAFLEEVVVELRRLYGRIDELEAQALTQAARAPEDDVSERVQREQQQVELIRAERRDLVSEIAESQARLDASKREAEEAEARAAEATSAAQEAEARRAETMTDLEEAQTRWLRARAEYDETVAAQERAAVELRTLRVAAAQQASQVLPALDLPKGDSPQEDLDLILEVARASHHHYVDEGRREGDRLREEAKEAAARLLAAAQEQVEELVAGAQAEKEQLLTDARAEHDRMLEAGKAQQGRFVTDGMQTREKLLGEGQAENRRLRAEGRAEHDELIAQARAEHRRLIDEAEEQRAGILADLQARRELLEARVVDLDRHQREYRDRLRGLVEQQLSVLDDDGWRADLTEGSES